jgi:hypothetical protein
LVAELFDHDLEVVNVGRRRDGKGGLSLPTATVIRPGYIVNIKNYIIQNFNKTITLRLKDTMFVLTINITITVK